MDEPKRYTHGYCCCSEKPLPIEEFNSLTYSHNLRSWGSACACDSVLTCRHRSGFCRTLSSFNVAEHPCVAFLGISVFPLHTSLSVCNQDMPLFIPFGWRMEAFSTSLRKVLFDSFLCASCEVLFSGLFNIIFINDGLLIPIHPTIKTHGLSGVAV